MKKFEPVRRDFRRIIESEYLKVIGPRVEGRVLDKQVLDAYLLGAEKGYEAKELGFSKEEMLEKIRVISKSFKVVNDE
jgi:hypothetical protein